MSCGYQGVRCVKRDPQRCLIGGPVDSTNQDNDQFKFTPALDLQRGRGLLLGRSSKHAFNFKPWRRREMYPWAFLRFTAADICMFLDRIAFYVVLRDVRRVHAVVIKVFYRRRDYEHLWFVLLVRYVHPC